MPTKIAIIGAGMAGLTLGHSLSNNADVTIFDKSRGAGGRLATRYADPFRFDHGVQFFTARTERFQTFLKPLVAAEQIAPWRARFTELHPAQTTPIRQWDETYPHYVGVPGMNCVGRALADGLDVQLNTAVADLSKAGTKWRLRDIDGRSLGEFDWVVASAPAAQTASLLSPHSSVAATAKNTRMLGCYALMLGLSDDFDRDFDAAVVRHADISWVAVNSTKPGRAAPPTMLVHASNAWADANMDKPLSEVAAHMEATLIERTGWAPPIKHRACHRWRYANIGPQVGPTCLLDADQQLAACGDWFIRGRVEAAFTSASDLATAMIAELKR